MVETVGAENMSTKELRLLKRRLTIDVIKENNATTQ
jgi:hypothetical protein